MQFLLGHVSIQTAERYNPKPLTCFCVPAPSCASKPNIHSLCTGHIAVATARKPSSYPLHHAIAA